MKAAIYLGQEHVAVQELPDPVCGDNDVIIRKIFQYLRDGCGSLYKGAKYRSQSHGGR